MGKDRSQKWGIFANRYMLIAWYKHAIGMTALTLKILPAEMGKYHGIPWPILIDWKHPPYIVLQGRTTCQWNRYNNEQTKKELSTRVPIFWYRFHRIRGKKSHLTLIKWFFYPNFMKSAQKIGTLVLGSFFICSFLYISTKNYVKICVKDVE